MEKQKISPFTALQYRDFRLLWIGLLISRVGSEMQVVAMNWHVYLLTGSALSLGLIGLSRFLPVVLFSLPGGIAADRFDRKKIMLVSQVFMIISSLVLTIDTFFGSITPLHIYLLIAASSIASTFDTPARQSVVPYLVPKKHFVNAVSLSTIMWQTAVVLGPSLAGFIIAFYDVGAVYFINTISFLGVIIALVSMSKFTQEISKVTTFSVSSIIEGLNFVRRTPILYSTMLLDFFATFFSSATVLLPIFAKDILAVGPQGLGLLYAAPSLGGILAGFILSSLGHIRNQGKVLIAAVGIYGLATILFGVSRSFYLSLFFLFFTGAGDIISTIIRNTIRQLVTPNYLRGRMVSINMLFFMGGPQLGEVEAGVVAAAFGAPFSVVIGGIGALIATTILSLAIPKLIKYRGDELAV